MSKQMRELLAFVRQLPAGIAYAPIYCKGSKLQSGKESKGKTPLERSHHERLDPADVALQIERRPEVFQAVGAFTGARSGGLVILDVDRNLSRLKKKWGASLAGAPVITSTKGNAAKYLYRVPEALWGAVKGFGLSDTGEGYEVLWGRQGLIYGAYPGSSDGKAPAGEYGIEGDLEAIPEAPEWLIAEMKAAHGSDITDGGFIRNRKALDFSDRDADEVAEIVQSALKVVPPQGAGSRDHWVKVGMAIHSELPNEKGLELWSVWSAKDPEYADEWDGKNPCEEVWGSFKPGAVTLGTLFWMADQQMPGRLWLSEDLRGVVAEIEADNVTRIRQVTLSYAEVILRAKEIQMLDNPAEANHRMNALALEAGYRDAGAVERLLISHIQYESQDDDMDLGTLLAKDLQLEYLIPDLLPIPGVVMIHGAGGDGKSMAAWTIAKHVARGIPFSIRNELVPVQQGKVLILNGDQPDVQVKQQMMDQDLTADDPIHLVMGWDLNWYLRFTNMIKKHQPKLVIIDSITGCSRGSAYDENKKEYANPLYWLTNNNGRLFPACTILLIHHANRAGGFRGTSSLRDSVDEVWGLRKPTDKEAERLGHSTRLITVEKSRAGRGGSKLLMKMKEDLTFSITDLVESSAESATPASIVDRVLQRLQSAAKHNEGRTRTELHADPICGGSVEGIKKALQRLETRGLVISREEPSPKRTGSSVKRYFALVSRDMSRSSCPPIEESSLGQEKLGGQPPSVSPHVSPLISGSAPAGSAGTRIKGDTSTPCPPETTSVDAGFARGDIISDTPQGNERSSDEIDALIDAATETWS